ncbi:hypothetical protein L0668_05420 [Paraglaciecola aquimarina]|uniref:Solute-binding protein family 3/N-terminal domain-containing protein n=1 Tax=Paraglaciecola algarum TaxID=3050085 RepID=A0ABS9D3P2_9ALTE|nr:hypothetical protein [Paraglaciecola sp. G1-23]MCF2947538.1 hypothetical protein [Paraglaciecola sp. G1-23]
MLFSCLTLGTTNCGYAQQPQKKIPIHMTALNFPGATQFNHKGLFDLLVAHVDLTNGIAMDYQVTIPARGARIFYSRDTDCIIPATLLDVYYEGYDVLSTTSFATVDYVAFTQSSNVKIVNKMQLQGKLIGIVRDEGKWDLKKRLQIPNAKYIELIDVRSMIGMLAKGRLDAIVHDATIVISALKRFRLENIEYDINSPILVDDLGIVCHKSPQTEEYIRQFNIELDSLLQGPGLAKFHSQIEIE